MQRLLSYLRLIGLCVLLCCFNNYSKATIAVPVSFISKAKEEDKPKEKYKLIKKLERLGFPTEIDGWNTLPFFSILFLVSTIVSLIFLGSIITGPILIAMLYMLIPLLLVCLSIISLYAAYENFQLHKELKGRILLYAQLPMVLSVSLTALGLVIASLVILIFN